ncbi:ABC transporter efflux protein, DrrB family [Geodermatophilus saharensis]|uniref:Transport permease protein n=1 Tax=Geodermatophilus saharensis TaxID=1137994 RepID=A0A239F3C0_9ACTN|nr:ABC transporter permease [Geodermatophilus saharensis]SNS50773.1 ABC transporter efflux protein, DrrB family [Geodermatophilus saharensis]
MTAVGEGTAGRLRWAVADALTVAGRDVAHWRRQPAGLLATLLFPVLLMVTFVYLLGGGIPVPGGSYRDFMVPGMLALVMLFGLEGTMTAVVTDTQRGVTDRFRALPMAPSAVVTGRCLADLAASVAGLAVVALAGLAVGWRPDPGPGLLGAAALLLLLRVGFLWVGIWLGLLTRDPALVTAVQVLVWPFAFLSNVFVPVSSMPAWLGTLAEWNPVAATVTAVRELTGVPVPDGGWATGHAALLAVAWPVLLTVVFAALAVRRWQGLSR